MEVTLLKFHNGKEAGEVIEVPEGIAYYLYRVGAAEPVEEADRTRIEEDFNQWLDMNKGLAHGMREAADTTNQTTTPNQE